MKSNQESAVGPERKSGRVRRFLRENRAVSALEYAILVGVIAVGIGTALVAFESEVSTALENAGNKIKSINGLGTT